MFVQETADIGYVVTGSIEPSIRGKDVAVIKMASDGNIEWQKLFGGSKDDTGAAIQQTSDGGYLVIGSTQSDDDYVQGRHSGGGRYPTGDLWLFKLDSNGYLQWQKCLGGTGDDSGSFVQETGDGGFIALGSTSSTDGDVTACPRNWQVPKTYPGSDIWVMQGDAGGKIRWQRCLGGSSQEEARSMDLTADGGIILIGTTNSKDGDVTCNHGKSDIWIVKTGNNGEIDWQQCLGGDLEDLGTSIQQTRDGGYIGAGLEGNRGSVVFRLDSSGRSEWERVVGAGLIFSVREAADGGYIMTGTTPVNCTISGCRGKNDVWVGKLRPDGSPDGERALGGSGFDGGYDIEQASDDGYILTGVVQTEFDWNTKGDKTDDGDIHGLKGLYDMWVVKLSPDHKAPAPISVPPGTGGHFPVNPDQMDGVPIPVPSGPCVYISLVVVILWIGRKYR
jgi:hypothetical protein